MEPSNPVVRGLTTQRQVHLHAGRNDHHRAASRSKTCWRTASGSLPSGAKTRRPSDNCTGVIPSGACNRSCSTAGVDDPPMPALGSATVASFAAFLPAKPNWTRQRNTMLVTIPWRQQTTATLTPGCSASKTMASFSLSAKLRRFERLSRVGSASRAAVESFSGEQFLAALLAPVLIRGRALG